MRMKSARPAVSGDEERREEAVPDADAPVRRSRAWRMLPLLIIICLLAVAYLAGVQDFVSLSYLGERRNELIAFVDRYPVLAPLAFLCIYALAVTLAFPVASVLTVFGGFLFGWLLGGVLVAFAATIGACAIFLIARSALGGFLRERVSGRAARIAQGFEDNAFGYLLVLRLTPIFPFVLINIAMAMSRIDLRTYAAATFIGILPGTFAYAWLGQGVDSVLVAARQAGQDATLADLATPEITIAFVLLALVALVPTVVRTWRGRSAGRG